jgi:hypothetical protein
MLDFMPSYTREFANKYDEKLVLSGGIFRGGNYFKVLDRRTGSAEEPGGATEVYDNFISSAT